MFLKSKNKIIYDKETEERDEWNGDYSHSYNISVLDGLRLTFALIIQIVLAMYKYIKNIFSKPKSLKGKLCLVTGAGRGLGRELCLKLAKQGAEIVCVDIREEANLETVKLIKDSGGKAHGYTCNVAKYEEVTKLAETVQRDVGRVYMLINNAGILLTHKAGEWPPEDVITFYNVNVIAIYWTIKAFLPSMKEVNEGHIVNIISGTALTPLPGVSLYGPTKAAVDSMTSTLRMELCYNENNKIIVTGVYPAVIDANEEVKNIYLGGKVAAHKVGDVAKTVIEGIKYNKTFIPLPKIVHFLHPIWSCWPEMTMMKCFEILNIRINIPSEKYKKSIPFNEIKQKCS